ncbi:histidine kinase [Clostridiaceae bacterium HSG29]|nr:histidine kinase [Clostridiaceae bacterium HSG29]
MNRKHSIKRSLFLISILIIISLVIGNLFSYISYRKFNSISKKVNERVYEIKDMVKTNSNIDTALSNFALSKDTSYMDVIFNNYQDLKILIKEYKNEVYDRKSCLYLENIEYILDNEYYNILESTIWSIRGVNEDMIQNNYYEFKKLNQYVNIYFDLLFEKELDYSREIMLDMDKISSQINYRIIVLLFISLLFIFIIGISYGRRLLANLKKLTDVAEEVSGGNFNVEKIELNSDDETALLAEAFNKLIENTKLLIIKIKENANFEVMLHKEESEKAKVEVLLNQAKLKGLQAQINPHFLFNTLNVIAKTAILEDADDTCMLIESVSDMLRYNLKNIDTVITINEEIINLQNYILIQKARFGERVKFEIDIENEVLNFKIPFLTLQPIVENAFMHGVEDLEEGGIIKVYSANIKHKKYLVVEDNGNGMDEDKINSLLTDNTITSHSTGIGISNVKRRLEFFYNSTDTIFIESQIGVGTKVLVKLKENLEVRNV